MIYNDTSHVTFHLQVKEMEMIEKISMLAWAAQ